MRLPSHGFLRPHRERLSRAARRFFVGGLNKIYILDKVGPAAVPHPKRAHQGPVDAPYRSNATLCSWPTAARRGRPNMICEVSAMTDWPQLAWQVADQPFTANTYRTMVVSSNSFCAGGSVLGNGTWSVASKAPLPG